MSTMKERDHSLDLVKVTATILIMLHHYQQVTGARFDRGINFYGGRFYFGYVVELFFLLSGYFMHKYVILIRERKVGFFEYMTKRIIRFVPMLTVCALSFAFLSGIYKHMYGQYFMDKEITLWGLIVSCLGIQEGWVFKNPGINNPTWYISVLMLCCVVLYLCVYISARLKLNEKWLFVFLIFVGAGFFEFKVKWLFASPLLGRGYYSFFFGLLLYDLMNGQIAKRKAFVLIAAAVLAAFTSLMILKPGFVNEGQGYILTFIVYPAVLIIVRWGLPDPVVNRKVWGTLGCISFDVFMWHVNILIVFSIIEYLSGHSISYGDPAVMLLFVLICFAVGTASYYLIEKPAGKKLAALCEMGENK